ncbi:MAG: tyrosine-type recombinase/integrase [Steroidobacteraceae bacterium]
MFEIMFKTPALVARHENGPYPQERFRFLHSLIQTGYQPHTIYCASHELLRVAFALRRLYSGLDLMRSQVDRAVKDYCGQHAFRIPPSSTKYRLQLARRWLRYLGYLQDPPFPSQGKLEEYCMWCHEERGLADETIAGAQSYVKAFLSWYGRSGRTMYRIRSRHIDQYLSYGANTRKWSRRSVYNVAKALRGFFRFGASRGWVPTALATAIRGPRLYSLEQLPCGPSWPEVSRIFQTFDSSIPKDIRDRAIFMLLAIYGLRSIEVRHLQLEDIDWDRDLLRIRRGKHNSVYTYPLLPSVGDAILAYLQQVRPRSTEPAVFLALRFPHRPISRGVAYRIVRNRLSTVTETLPHRGTHALRHACATHLLARGFSLKEIGDHLGHRRALSTRVYAKVDRAGLHRVAAFDIGALS